MARRDTKNTISGPAAPAASALPTDAVLEVRATAADPDSVVRPYGYQREMAAITRDPQVRYAMFEWTRQGGKSTGCGIAINDDVLTTEAQRRRILWVLISRSLEQARELSLKVRNIARAIAEAKKILLPVRYTESNVHDPDEGTFTLEYPGGSRVKCVSASPDAAAGYTGNPWWDEVGLTKRQREIFRAAFGVASRNGLRFFMTSTPRPGFWNQTWEAEARDPQSLWKQHRVTLPEAIAQGAPMDLDVLRKGMRNDLDFRQEYLCEHVDDDVCWLPWELIVGSFDPRCTMSCLPLDAANAAYAGWDVARWHDLSVLWIIEKIGGLFITRGVLVMQRMKFDLQIELVKSTLSRWPKMVRLCIDATGMGEMVAEQAQRRMGRVEGVKMTGPSKEIIAGDVRRVMEDRTLRTPDDDAVRNDLHSVHRTTTAMGNPRFEGEADGSHADRFWALSLALHAALNQVRPFILVGGRA